MNDIVSYAQKLTGPMSSGVILAERTADASWRSEYINAAAAAIVGDREDELLERLKDVMDNVPEDRESVWTGKLWGKDLSARMVVSGEGERMIVLRDVTDELRLQQERVDASRAALQSALDAANAANKAKSDFLSNMSHDIRTPLNAIIGLTTVAQAHLDESGRVADCLEKIGHSSRHLLALINDILDMSRIESGKMTVSIESFAMADFIHSLLSLFRPQADKKRQRVELDFTGLHHEKVRGDQLRIQQVLINILSNAVKFTPEEGMISLTVREREEAVKAGHTYSYYEFTVRDTGMGMSPEFLEKIFQPFERASSVSRIEGTGLGMTITHNLVKMMNGEISVESEEGRGTCFTVTLPLELDLDGNEAFTALRGLRILAADDDRTSLDNLREILSDLGMECDTCGNAYDAMEMAAQARMDGRDYFAMILDWRLPVVDGVQACRELRTMLGAQLPIFIMSAYEWTLTGDEMRKYGVTDFIPKPLFRTRLGQTLYAWTDEGKREAQSAGEDSGESFKGFRLLLVEDNEINREIGVELLEMLGAEVVCAENGREALELFRDSPDGSFDLIFMDIQMPIMDGFEATRAIRALPGGRGKKIPIVAMSANAFVEDIRASERAGMDAHVPKPVSIESISAVMRRFLGPQQGDERGPER